METLGILSFTKKGKALEKNIIKKMPHVNWVEKEEWEKGKDFINRKFNDCDGWIFIGACGIFVRFIAPLIKSKDVDPAVIVLDEMGENVISLLSGHLGGGNDLTVDVAKIVGGRPVITTATDVNKKFAVDNWAKSENLYITDISMIKEISKRVLEDEKIGLFSDFEIDKEVPDFIIDLSSLDEKKRINTIKEEKIEAGVVISLDGAKRVFPIDFNVVPKIVTLGIGCRKGIDSEKLEAFVLKTLKENKIDIEAVLNIASIDLKKEEVCLLDFCKKYNKEFITYEGQELNSAEGDFTCSSFVSSITGVDNVCERSAFLASEEGKIIVKKTKFEGMTIAIALKNWQVKF